MRDNKRLELTAYGSKTGDRCSFRNGQKILSADFGKNKTLLRFLVWLLQDVNWPGAAEAIQYLSSLSRDVVIPLAKEALYIADKNDDFMWIGGIRLLIETAGYKNSDFNADIDRILEKADF